LKDFDIQYPRPERLVGREFFLQRLHEHLQRVRGYVEAPVLCGPEGIGKTHIAIEYAYRHAADYPGGVYYINARRNWSFELAKIAQQRGLRPVRRVTAQLEHERWLAIALQRHLADELKMPILLIFDNIADPLEIRDREIGQGLHVADLKAHLLIITETMRVPEPFLAFPVEPLTEEGIVAIIGEKHASLAKLIGGFPQSAYLLHTALRQTPNLNIAALRPYLEQHDPINAMIAWHRDHLDVDALDVWKLLATFRREAVIPRARLALMLDKPQDILDVALDHLYHRGLIELHLNGDLELHARVRRYIRRWVSTYRDGFRAALFRFIKRISEPETLYQHIRTRGIRQVQLDLEELSIASLDDGPPPLELTNLKRLIEWEAPHLREWDRHSVWPIQQIRERAHHQQLDTFRDQLDDWLANHPHFRTESAWRYPLNPSLIETFWGHEGPIAAAINLDGQHVITAAHDGTLRLWDMFAGQTLRQFSGHQGRVNAVGFFDYDHVLSAGDDHSVRLWNIHSGACKLILNGHTAGVRCVVRLDEERVLSGGDDHTLRLWHIPTRAEIRQFVGHSEAITAILVLDRKSALTASMDGTIRQWNLITGEMISLFVGHEGPVHALARLDHDLFASAGADHSVHIWRISTGENLQQLVEHPHTVISLCAMENGLLAAGCGDGTILVWRPLQRRLLRQMKGHLGGVTDIVQIEQQQLVSVGVDRTVRLWDISLQHPPLETPLFHHDWVNTIVRLSSTDAITASADGTMIVFDTHTAHIKEQLKGHQDGVRVILKIDDLRVVSGADDGTMWLWTSTGGKKLREFKGHTDEVVGIVRLNAAHLLSAGGDGTIQQWDLRQSEPIRVFAAATRRPTGLVGVNERAFVTAESDHILRLWDLDKTRIVREFRGHSGTIRAMCLMGQTRLLSASNDKTVRLWSLITGAGKVMAGHTNSVTGVVALDERFCVSVSFDRTIRLWDTLTTEQRALLRLDDPLLSVCVLGGYRIAVGDMAGKVHVLRVHVGPIA